MSPHCPSLVLRRMSFPRVSGDEPLAQFKDDTFHKFSPRERG